MTTASGEFDPKDPIASFAATWKRVLLEPRAFFEGLPEGGLEPPLLFALICLAIGGLGFMIFGGGVKGLLGVLLIGMVRLFVGAAIVSLIAQQLFEGRGDYEATFRVLSYSTAVAVVIGIPVIKYFAAIYGIYLVILGLARAHSFDTVRALLTALASVFVGMVIIHALGLGGWMHRHNPLLRWKDGCHASTRRLLTSGSGLRQDPRRLLLSLNPEVSGASPLIAPKGHDL